MGTKNRNHWETTAAFARSAVLLVSLGLLTACGDFSGGTDPADDPFSGSGAAPSGVSEAEQIQFYTDTLWPILNGNTCGGCHTVAGGRPFPFADGNIALGYRTLVDNAKINFGTPSASRVYVQVAANAHHCWSGDCQADASEILAEIQNWITMIEEAGGSSTGGEIVNQGTLVSNEVSTLQGIEGRRRRALHEQPDRLLALRREDRNGRTRHQWRGARDGHQPRGGHRPHGLVRDRLLGGPRSRDHRRQSQALRPHRRSQYR